MRRLGPHIGRAGGAIADLGSAAAFAADAVEALAHELLHRWDGPGGQPCGRCAALLTTWLDNRPRTGRRTDLARKEPTP